MRGYGRHTLNLKIGKGRYRIRVGFLDGEGALEETFPLVVGSNSYLYKTMAIFLLILILGAPFILYKLRERKVVLL